MGVTLPLVPMETAFRDQYALEGHEVRLAEQQCSKLIDVELPPRIMELSVLGNFATWSESSLELSPPRAKVLVYS